MLMRRKFEEEWLNRHADSALQAAKTAMAACEAVFSSKSPQHLRSLLDLALAYRACGEEETAQRYETEGDRLFDTLKNERHGLLRAALTLFEAEHYWAAHHDRAEVQALFDAAVALFENHSPVDLLTLGEALTRRAEFHYVGAEFDKAILDARRALTVFSSLAEPDSIDPAKAREILARGLHESGQSAEAAVYFDEAMRGLEADASPQRRYALWIGWAEALEQVGNVAEAEALRAKAGALLPTANPGEFGFHV
jgi:tetratricopeptide (TPR) repeat protein